MTSQTPATWPELMRHKVQMQIDLLSHAARIHQTPKLTAKALSMTQTNYYNACKRLGINPKTGEVLA